MTVADFKKAYTGNYWVTYTDRKSGCIDCNKEEDPLEIAARFGTIKTIDSLPYPANPVIYRRPLTEKEQATGWGHCPEFCYSPSQCKGRTSCPQSCACSE